MQFNFLGKTFTIWDNKQVKTEDNFITNVSNRGYQYVWQDITSCGRINIDRHTMYRVHKTNKMAFSYTQKISQMVGAKWFSVIDYEENEISESEQRKVLETLYSYVWRKHEMNEFIKQFFDQAFANGQVFAVPTKINWFWLLASTDDWIKLLDGRGMSIKTDKYDNPVSYEYKSKYWMETIFPTQIVDYIAYRDIDCVYRGESLYRSVVMDAITNDEASRTQMYFFKNNAQPNLFIMLNPEAFKWQDWPEKKKQFDTEWDKKYSWPDNTGKYHSSYVANDIKTLDLSNVDLDLINLRKDNDASLSTVFMLDSRLIGLQKDSGSYGEVEVTTITQGNEQIDAYGYMFSDFITAIYKKFIDPTFQYYIKTKNAEFKNIYKDKELWIKEREKWLITPNEYRQKFDMVEATEEDMNMFSIIGWVSNSTKKEEETVE